MKDSLICLITLGLGGMALSADAAGLYLSPEPGKNYVQCEGTYSEHLQGIATNNTDALYWSFNNRLVKTDRSGRVVLTKNVIYHHGDLCFANGKIYVAVNDVGNGGVFNQPASSANSANQWIYEYDAETLNYNTRYPVPEAIHGAGGITYHNGRFLVVGGLPPGSSNNLVFEYDSSFAFKNQHPLPTGYTDRGIQTAAFAAGHWWFGTYDSPRELLKFTSDLASFQQFDYPSNHPFNPSYGIESVWDGNLLVADDVSVNGNHVGRVYVAAISPSAGLQLIQIPVPETCSLVSVCIGFVCVVCVCSYRYWRPASHTAA